MKRYFILALAVLFMFSSAACSGSYEAIKESTKPVRVMEVKEQESPAVLFYTGIVNSGSLKKLAFKSTGKIAKIHVEEGQSVKKGDMLVELESKDLKYALAASKGQMDAARAMYEKALNGASPEELKNAELNVEKAKAAYDYAQNNYKRIEALFNAGAVSRNQMEQAKLEADIRESEYNQAKELFSQMKNGARTEDKEALRNQLEQAKADYEYKANLVEDAAMTSNGEGRVVEILYEEGELVPAGYPVVVMRENGAVVDIGLAEKDLSLVTPGMEARVSVGGKTVPGTVEYISQMPDKQTRTYNAEIALEEDSFNLGAVARVEVITGIEKGIWVPIGSMLSDGMDYVYVVKDNIAEKKEIVIESIKGSMARVSGLNSGEQLVVEGMKRLRAGDGISIIK